MLLAVLLCYYENQIFDIFLSNKTKKCSNHATEAFKISTQKKVEYRILRPDPVDEMGYKKNFEGWYIESYDQTQLMKWVTRKILRAGI